MNGEPSERQIAVEAMLREFRRTADDEAVANREPACLFAAVREVLLIAAGKPLEETGARPRPAAVADARFFIRRALLRPTGDPYALFGLLPGADLAAVKDRYRSMMRLMHPDFVMHGDASAWPADAAYRVNQAYHALSSPARHSAPVASRAPAARPTSVGWRAREGWPRHRLKWIAASFGGAGGVAVMALALVLAGAETDPLVQRGHAAQMPLAAMAHAPSPSPSPTRASRVKPPPAPSAQLQPRAAAAVVPLNFTPVQAFADRGDGLHEVLAPEPERTPTRVVALEAAMPLKVALAAPPPIAQEIPLAAPTMSDAHQLLAKLVQSLEGGWGDRMIAQLDRDVRYTPAAQELGQYYDTLVGGAQPVRVSQVNLQGEQREGRLTVTGRIVLQVSESRIRTLPVSAEFAWRDGRAVLTRLARGVE